jgi:hypothetical protein
MNYIMVSFKSSKKFFCLGEMISIWVFCKIIQNQCSKAAIDELMRAGDRDDRG